MFSRGTQNKVYLFLGAFLLTLKLDSSYKPIGIIDSVDAFSMVWKGKAVMVERYDSYLKSGNDVWDEPAVIVLHRYIDFPFFRVGCTRREIFKRDKYVCQYCHYPFSGGKLTLDHVIPKSRGGQKSWENLVTCCIKCNQKKGDRLLREIGMHLWRRPIKPRYRLIDWLGPSIPGIWKPYLSGVYTK